MADESTDQFGLNLPGFEILEKIAEGGMGSVYKARQLSLGRIVALKILPARLAHDETYVRQFQIESRAAANLKHPHLIEVYDAGQFEGTHFFVMEYVEGETVGERLRRDGAFIEHAAVTICMNVAQALQYAWEKAQLIHGDIKPDNLILEQSTKSVRIADLGLGKCQLEHGDHPTGSQGTAHAMGTPAYLSPEQARGDKQIDFRSDMYALGATLYHMITGKIPFDGLAPVEVMAQHLQGHLPDPRTVRTAISESLVVVLERMLARDPASRYPTWAALAHDLTQIHVGRSPSVPPLPPERSTLSRTRVHAAHVSPTRKPTPWGAIAGVAVAVLILLAIAYWRRQHVPDEQAPVPAPVEPQPSPAPVAPSTPTTEPDAPIQQPAVVDKPVEDEAETKARALAQANERYATWRNLFESFLGNGDYQKAREAVTSALGESSLALVKDRLQRDERVVQLILGLRQTAIQNLPGQAYFLGSAPGKISRVEGDKFWVRLSSGEVAVPIDKLDPAKVPSIALHNRRSDPDLNLGAGLYSWYRGEKELARVYFETARKAGADVDSVVPEQPTPTVPPTAEAEKAEQPTPAEPVAPAVGDGRNMLANPGFDRWTGKTLLDWSLGGNSVRPVQDTTVALDGDSSARFDCKGPQSIMLEQPFQVRVGEGYQLRFSYRTKDLEGKLWVEMGPPGDPMPVMKEPLPDSLEWQMVSLEFTAPATSTLQLRFRGSGITGVFWLDRVDLRLLNR